MSDKFHEQGSRVGWYFTSMSLRFRLVIWLSIFIVITIALLDLAGWAFDITLLKSVQEHWIPMRVITAICLIFTATGLALIGTGTSKIKIRLFIRALAIFILIASGLTLFTYIFIFTKGTEPVLVEVSVFKLILTFENRMAFYTACNLLFISFVLLLLTSENKRNSDIAHILIIPVSLSSYFVPITYILGVYSVHSLENVPVALNTGVALCGICVAVLLIKPDTWLLKVFTSGNMGGIIARKLLPPLLILPVLIAWFRMLGEDSGLFSSDEGVVFVALTYTFCFLILVWLSSRSINTIDIKRQESEDLLRKSYDELEIRVQERTSELLELNKLLDAEINKKRRAEENLKNINADLEQRVDERTKEYHYAAIEIERYSQKMEILSDVSSRLLESDDPQTLVNELCNRVMMFLDCDVFFNFIVDEKERRLHLNAYSGIDEEEALKIEWLNFGIEVCSFVADDGKRIIAENIPSTPDRRTDHIKTFGVKAYACHPLLSGTIVIGTLSFGTRKRLTFNDEDIALMKTVADQVALAMSRVENDRRLRESEEKYRMLFETMIEGFAFHEIITDENGEPCDYRFLSINPAFEKQTGLKASDVVGKRVLEVLSTTEKYWIDTYGKVALSGENLEFENYSSELNSYFHVTAFCPRKGYFAVIFENITERKIAEQEVKEAKEKLDLALENAKIGLWEWDIMKNELFLDERMERLFGIGHSSETKKFGYFETIIYEEDLPFFRNSIDNAINENIPFDTVFRIRSHTGDLNHISTKAKVGRDKSGLPVRMTGVCFDISDMKKGAEQAIFSLNENLIRSNRELEQFAYVASHDLQEPLRMVSSFTQLLSMRYKDKLDSDANEFIQYAVDGALRMQVLINDLLEYSRVETKGKALSLIDMHDALGHAIKNLSIRIKEKNALISNDELPVVVADSVQMSQLFQNLISNALKFCSTSPRIHISSVEENGHYLFSVRDNGIGIEPQYFNKIFQIFQRLHGKEEYGGTGIGLSICRRIIERHGGKIWVESKPDEGSVFYFTILKK